MFNKYKKLYEDAISDKELLQKQYDELMDYSKIIAAKVDDKNNIISQLEEELKNQSLAWDNFTIKYQEALDKARDNKPYLDDINKQIDKLEPTLNELKTNIDYFWYDNYPKTYNNKTKGWYDNKSKKLEEQLHRYEKVLKDNIQQYEDDDVMYLAIMSYVSNAKIILSKITYNNYAPSCKQLEELKNNINKRLRKLNRDEIAGFSICGLIEHNAQNIYRMAVIKELQKQNDAKVREQEKLEQEIRQKEEELMLQINDDNIYEINKEINQLEEKKKLTKAGYVYVISNPDMWDGVYKIGITRRLDYTERIKELSNASHAYQFVVHGVVWSENCFELEANMHKYFAKNNINPCHFHKEHFKVSLDEIEEAFKSFGYDVQLDKNIQDEEYIESMKILQNNGVII